MKFAVDSMLGKLARWLRILGYDSIHDPALPFRDLVEQARSEERILLTRRKTIPDGISLGASFFIRSDSFPEQLRIVVNHFNLDTTEGIFTRCLSCNVTVCAIEKNEAKDRVPKKSWEGFDEFFECPNCRSVFWGGAHRTNTLKRMSQILHEH